MRLLIIVLTAFLLSSCDNSTYGSPSFGEKIVPTRNDLNFSMTVEIVPSEKITDVCHKLGVSYDANGCASFDLDNKHCTIYVVEPRGLDDKDRFSVVGHETWHCAFGRWHD